MSGLTASEVLERFCVWIEGTSVADKSHAMDRFVRILGADELRNDEHDRRFYCLAVEGPMPANNSSCIEALVVEFSARWLNAWASQSRMLDDIGALRARIKAFTASEPYMYQTLIQAEARADYVTLATSALATFRVRLEYHK